MSLLELPTEILHQIVSLTTPRSFEALILSCKKLHSIGKNLIPRHNALCRQYRNISLLRNQLEGGDLTCLHYLVRAIQSDPIVAEYIETADLSHDDCSSSNEKHRVSFTGLEAWWRQAMGQGAPAIVGHDWFGVHPNPATRPSGALITVAMLGILPNLRQLSLPWCWGAHTNAVTTTSPPEVRDQFWRLLDCLALRASDDTSDESRILRNLQRIEMINPSRPTIPIDLQCLVPFLSVAALREVVVSDCHPNGAFFGFQPLEWRYGSRVSNVRKITLASSCINGEHIATVLQHCPHLHTLYFSYGSKRHTVGDDWDVNAFMTALIETCADSVEDLSLSVESLGMYLKTGIRTLQPFQKLRKLEIEPRFWFGPEITTEINHLSAEQYRNHAYAIGWNGSMLPNLTSILPSSMQSVRFMAGASREDVLILKGMFKHFEMTTLPSLERLSVVRNVPSKDDQAKTFPPHSQAAWDSVRQIVSEAGAKFETTSQMKPEWMTGLKFEPEGSAERGSS